MNELANLLSKNNAAAIVECAKRAKSATPIATADAEALWQRAGDAWQKVALISLGNSLEDHGPALAPDIDDRLALSVCQRICQITGARYLGHSPFCTDALYPLAKHWSPVVISAEQFVAATAEVSERFLRTVYDEPGLMRPRHLFWVSGHGGNGCAKEALQALAPRLGVKRCSYQLAFQVPDELADDFPAQHAGEAEHAIGAALGCLDVASLDQLNQKLTAASQQDDIAPLMDVLARYPTVGGMAGLYLLGDQDYEPIRQRYAQKADRGLGSRSLKNVPLKQSIVALLRKRKITASESLGRRLLEHAARVISDHIAEQLA
jgi:creatinine amidohydrolase/Fe(II)-dependent formamide hydrolase-like protein